MNATASSQDRAMGRDDAAAALPGGRSPDPGHGAKTPADCTRTLLDRAVLLAMAVAIAGVVMTYCK